MVLLMMAKSQRQYITNESTTVYYQRINDSILPTDQRQYITNESTTVYYQRINDSILPVYWWLDYIESRYLVGFVHQFDWHGITLCI